MSAKPSETLLNARGDLDRVLTKIEFGTKDYPRSLTRVDIAHQRAQDRAGAGQLPAPGIRGGTSHPKDRDENIERLRAQRQAEKDAWDIAILAARIAADARELKKITDRQAEVIHDSKRPVDTLPGCRACGRKEDLDGTTIGPHWAGVTDKAPASGLCRQCNDFKNATNGIPPFMWCHLRHTKGMAHANRWLAKEYPNLLESVQRKAKSDSFTIEDLQLDPEKLIA